MCQVCSGRIVTKGALVTQRQMAQTIVDKGGDDIMIVKDSQRKLKAETSAHCSCMALSRPAANGMLTAFAASASADLRRAGKTPSGVSADTSITVAMH